MPKEKKQNMYTSKAGAECAQGVSFQPGTTNSDYDYDYDYSLAPFHTTVFGKFTQGMFNLLECEATVSPLGKCHRLWIDLILDLNQLLAQFQVAHGCLGGYFGKNFFYTSCSRNPLHNFRE
jgi:hypothetical protein